MLSEWSLYILTSLSTFLNVKSLPAINSNDWNITSSWTKNGNHSFLTAQSNTIGKKCAQNINYIVQFPGIIQAAQYVSVDGHNVFEFNDASFKSVQSFYGSPYIPCTLLANKKIVEWKVVSFTHYFARLSAFPKIEAKENMHNFFAETLHSVSAGALIILGLFSLIVFPGKVSTRAVYSLGIATIFLACYFMGMTPKAFQIPGSMLTLHKLSDVCMWIGVVGVFSFLDTQGLFNRNLLKIFFIVVAISIIIILFAPNGDVTQLGTTLPFLFAPIILPTAMWRSAKALKNIKQNKLLIIVFLEVFIFAFTASNDIAVILGVFDSVPLLPIGMLAILFFAALSLEEQVKTIYRERDYLRSNLEAEVKVKTSSLEQAVQSLKSVQNELVQSAKLAGLGTLAAGIAHEINNSLNYVNGSLSPLINFLKKETLSESERAKAMRLIEIMKDGLNLTSKIIVNLKSYAHAGVSEFKYIKIRETIEGVQAILQNKIRRGIEIQNNIANELEIYADKVSVSQILMNLIDNAIDAIESNHEAQILTFDAGEEENSIWVSIADNGPGISKEVLNQIYDPFFTTKAVGKGTGLGLYIVNNEMKRHGGRVELVSCDGGGTRFVLHFAREPREAVA